MFICLHAIFDSPSVLCHGCLASNKTQGPRIKRMLLKRDERVEGGPVMNLGGKKEKKAEQKDGREIDNL